MNSDVDRHQGQLNDAPKIQTINYFNNNQETIQEVEPEYKPQTFKKPEVEKPMSKPEEKKDSGGFDILKTDISHVGQRNSSPGKKSGFQPFQGKGVAIG